MHVKIVNTKNRAESWEKVYVSSEIKTSLLSKDCLIRLRVIDPTQFLSDSEVRSFSINTVDEKKTSYRNVKRPSILQMREPLNVPAQDAQHPNHSRNQALKKHLII